MIYYLSLAYVMAALLCFSYFISTSMFHGGRTSLQLASTQPPCYITMIKPKHTVSWHQLVPYIDTHNISWWIHDPTDTMGWFPSPFSTYLASDSLANAVFDHNYVNNNQILLLSKAKSIALPVIERISIVFQTYSILMPRLNARCRAGGL